MAPKSLLFVFGWAVAKIQHKEMVSLIWASGQKTFFHAEWGIVLKQMSRKYPLEAKFQ